MRSLGHASIRAGFLVVLLAGCISNDDDDCGSDKSLGKSSTPPYIGEYMFERCTALDVSAAWQELTVGDTVTIALSCQPIYSGSGTARVTFLPQRQSSTYQSMEIIAPLDATSPYQYTFHAPVRMTAGERFVMPWTIRVREKSLHMIHAEIGFDSVFVETDSALYEIRSERAKEVHGPLDPRPAANSAYVLPEPADAPR